MLLTHVYPAETFLTEDSDADNSKNIENFIRSELKNDKFPIIWFIDSKDVVHQLIVHTFSNMDKYRSYIRFGRFSDPSA